jgi:hypothetical protein
VVSFNPPVALLLGKESPVPLVQEAGRARSLRTELCRFIISSTYKGKAIPVTGRGGPYRCEKSRLSHFLDNRLTDGGEDSSLTRRPPFTPQEDSWYSLVRHWVDSGAIVRLEELVQMKTRMV